MILTHDRWSRSRGAGHDNLRASMWSTKATSDQSASVSSTEASNGRLARVGRIDRSVERSPCARRCRRTNGTSLGASHYQTLTCEHRFFLLLGLDSRGLHLKPYV